MKVGRLKIMPCDNFLPLHKPVINYKIQPAFCLVLYLKDYNTKNEKSKEKNPFKITVVILKGLVLWTLFVIRQMNTNP